MRSVRLAQARAWRFKAVAVVLLLLALAGCSPAASESEFSLTGVNWQWQSWADANGIDEVPNPADYTITFNTDNTLTGQADCNSFAGTYTQEDSGIQIDIGPSTLVACSDDSLGGAFTLFLDQVDAGGPDGSGNLALETVGGETRLIFHNPANPVSSTTLPLGLPWWAWLLAGLLLLGVLWLLMRGNRNATPTDREKERAAESEPEPVPATLPVVESKPVVKADDLTRIEGIGPKIASVLVASGITTFATLAGATYDELISILNTADIHGSYGDPTTWPAQAELAAAGDWDALASLQETLKGGRIE